MLDSVASPTSIKTATGKRRSALRTRIGWPEAVGCLQGAKTRQSFNTLRSARECAADALTHTQDLVESQSANRTQLTAIREVRRRLELELWP